MALPSTPDTRDAVRLVKMQIKNTVKIIKRDQTINVWPNFLLSLLQRLVA